MYNMYIYIYMYIYLYVCVCFCVCKSKFSIYFLDQEPFTQFKLKIVIMFYLTNKEYIIK